MDSSLLSARATVDQRRQTMTIGLGLTEVGELQSPVAVLFVTDVRNGITGLWVSQGGCYLYSLRGLLCPFPYPARRSHDLEAGGARRLRNEFIFSAPQLKRDSLGGL